MTEIVDIIDEEGKVIGTGERADVEKKVLRHRTAAVVIFNSKGEIFVHKRAEGLSKYPGMHDVKFAGWLTAGETFEEAAFRELEEESGIEAIHLQFLFEYNFDSEDNRFVSQVFAGVYDGEMKLDKSEISWGKFMEYSKIVELSEKSSFSPTGKIVLEKLKEFL